MRHKTTFICGLDQIELPMISGRGERFADVYFITRDRSKIVQLIDEFGDSLGRVEASYLADQAAAVVYRSSNTESEETDIDRFLRTTLHTDMLRLKSLELSLWLVKDNASLFDRAWIATPNNLRVAVHTNSWATRTSAADGTFKVLSFSVDELKLARALVTPQLPIYLGQTESPTSLQKGSERFTRFQYFVGAARSISDVALKIAQYCSGLEALVSTSQQELSHQVSERVAAILHPPGPDRIAAYRLIKQAYGYRSKAVHGATFRPTEFNQLREASEGIDEICRVLFGVYVDENNPFRTAVEGSDDTLNQFLVELLLGGPA
ncbi:hypothetical protein G6L05_22060 [Agrobacterium rhizogenes]|nr:hypothetical protein [Rhizobium rhizogenes]